MKKTSWNDRNLQKLLTKIGTADPTVVEGFSHWRVRGFQEIKEHYWYFTRAKIGKKIIWQIADEEPFKKKEVFSQGALKSINQTAWTLCSMSFPEIETWLLQLRTKTKHNKELKTL